MKIRYILDNLKNNFDFYLRNKLTFSRKNYSEKPRKSDDVFNNERQIETYKKLKEKYNFEILDNSSVDNFLYNLYFLNLFDICFEKNNKNESAILDIGSKNWYYAKAEYMFFKENFENFSLTGIEIDSNRLCSNLFSRKEIANYHIKNLKNTEYLQADFLTHKRKYDYIIWILPFITEFPHVKWGLPLKYFKPEEMLKNAYDNLNPKGEILIINQGEKEYLLQKELNGRLKLNAKYIGEIEDVFNLFENKRYCTKIIKP